MYYKLTIMDVAFLEGGSVEFIVSKYGLSMRFRIARPFKYGIEKWQFIRNGGIDENRYAGCKMSSTPSNMTLIFYEGEKPGTHQWIRLANDILELGIEIERGDKTHFTTSSIQIPLLECCNAIDKIIDHYERV
jgi:hypothetical protein